MSIKLNKQYTPAPKTERGTSYHMGGDPKEQRRIVYTSGQLVILKSIDDPLDVFIYQNHKYPTTCARMCPSGFYIASADNRANIIIWDTVGEDHVVKLEKQTIGQVTDMAWSPDSKRVVVVGKGASCHGEVFFMDSGAAVGTISQHIKPILSVDYRQERPFRIITGSEDMKANFFEGPPFKFKESSTKHDRFVCCTRFSQNGEYAVSVGTDKKIVLYDGKTFEFKKEVANAHNGGIYGASFSPDGNKLLTSSADKTCKIWSVPDLEPLTTFTFGKDLEDQQLGCLWQGNKILSVNLAGDISLLDESNPSAPSSVLMGHSVVIEALAYNQSNDSFYSGDRDGKIIGWDRLTGKTHKLTGAAHKSRVVGLSCLDGSLVSISFDDTCRISDIGSGAYGPSIKLPSQPTGVHSNSGWIAVSTRESVCMIKDAKIVQENKVSYQPSCVAISKDGSIVAVGGNDKMIHVYDHQNGKLTEKHSVTQIGSLLCVDISSNNSRVVGGDSDGNVCVWEGTTMTSENFGHGARIDKVKFNLDGTHVVSGSLDSSFIVWDLATNKRQAEKRSAHVGGVKDLFWADNSNIVTCGQDVLIQSWSVEL